MRDGLESAEYAEELTKLGSNLLQQKKPAAAEPILRESLAILLKKQPERPGHVPHRISSGRRPVGPPEVCRRRAALGAGLSGDFQSRRTAPSQKNHDPRTGQRLIDALERLVQQYDAWGKPDEAAKRRKELEEAKARFNRP